MDVGQIVYAVREDSAESNFQVISDLTIWKTECCGYEVYTGHPQDIEDLRKMVSGRVKFQDHSLDTRIYSVQGPEALKVLEPLYPSSTLKLLPYFHFQHDRLAEVNCLIGRLGYTGEAGFEIVVEGEQDAESLWEKLLENVHPGGMVAADILRIEAGFILFLNECRLQANAAELGVSTFSDQEKVQLRYRLICFECQCEFDQLPYSAADKLFPPNRGEVAITSVNRTQFAEKAIGFGFINTYDGEETTFNDPLKLFHQIRRAPRPYYDFHKTRPRGQW